MILQGGCAKKRLENDLGLRMSGESVEREPSKILFQRVRKKK